MTDLVPSNRRQLCDFIERILRIKSEQDDLLGNIRSIYAEAKAAGLDKQAVGQLVTYLRTRERNPDRCDERSAAFEAYRKAYAQASHAHARETTTQRPKTLQVAPPSSFGLSPEAATEDPGFVLEPVAPTFDPKVLRPHCQTPERCGGHGRTHCYSCTKAAGQLEYKGRIIDPHLRFVPAI